MVCLLLAVVALAATSAVAATPEDADSGANASIFVMPAEPESTELHLITVGLGEELYTRFGHTILLIEDPVSGSVQALNWGMFDFSDPNFGINFFLGRLTYRMGKDRLEHVLRLYRDYEKRRVWQQKINLTGEQKRELLTIVHRNGLPENRKYRYQYLFNNCSTVLRDYFDQVFDGELKKRFTAQKVDLTFRDYIYHNLNKPPIVAFFLDIVMNSRIDGHISKWEEMFLPQRLSEYFAEAPSRIANPGPDEGFLLGKPQILVDLPERPSSFFDAYSIVLVLFLVPLIWAGIFFGRNFIHIRQGLQASFARVRWALRLFGALLLLYAPFGFICGTSMILAWSFSEHLDLHHNASLWLFWPTDLLLILPAFLLTFRPRSLRGRPRLWRCARVYALLHLAAAAIFAIIHFTGGFDQNVRRAVIHLLPIYLLLFGALAKLATVLLEESQD